MILADTDSVIDFIHRRVTPDGAFMRNLAEDEIAISAVTVYELLFGAQERGRSESESFIERVRVLPVTEGSARIAALHGSRLALEGNRLDVPDLLIGGAALDNGVALISRNVRHFSRIDGLVLVDPN